MFSILLVVATPVASLTRRAGHAFDDVTVEEFAQSRAGGATIAIAAQHAGIGMAKAKTLEASSEVAERKRELRGGQKTLTTVSPAWVLEQLRKNAEDSATQAREEGRKDAAALFKASNDALELCYEIVTTDPTILSGIGSALPTGSNELRAELRKRLSANNDAITTAGVAVQPGADDEAAE